MFEAANKLVLTALQIPTIEGVAEDDKQDLPWRDFDAVGGERLAGADRQEANAILNSLRQAERSRQHATEVMQESEARKTRERERRSDWG